jgi:Golgi phosphoprotein 3 GPP34
MSPVLLSDAARVTLERPAAARADLRTDAMLLSHGRAGTEPLIAAALLIDAVRSRHLDVHESPRLVVVAGHPPRSTSRRPRGHVVVAGGSSADEPALLADLRARVLASPPGSPLHWIERTAEFASHRIATELITAGIAMPLSPRFAGTFTLSVNARAEAAARARIVTDPALAVLLYTFGFPTGDPLPPSAHLLPPAERAILAALRQTVRQAA